MKNSYSLIYHNKAANNEFNIVAPSETPVVIPVVTVFNKPCKVFVIGAKRPVNPVVEVVPNDWI